MSRVPVVSSEACRSHVPAAEIWVGVRTPGTEVPERVSVVLDAVRAAGADIVDAEPHADDAVLRVHDAGLVDHLRSAWDDWAASGLRDDPGQDRVVPYVFPTASLLGGLEPRRPVAVHARAGRWCYDTMTLIGPGTWEAVRAAVDCALTAVDLVHHGAPAAYALCRPPGHHATRDGFGGSCYLTNAAVAAQALLDGGARRVAVVDIDAHHGNGTQSLFYDRADVFYGSVHVDPGAGWFPHYLGFADEQGTGAGAGATHNEPLAPGSGDTDWLAAVRRVVAAAAAQHPDAVVLSLGVDAAAGDPESPLTVSGAAFTEAGRLVASLGPTVAVQEGGYVLATLGDLVCRTLTGLAPGR